MWAVPESLPVRSQVCIDLLCRISTKSSTLPGSTKSVPCARCALKAKTTVDISMPTGTAVRYSKWMNLGSSMVHSLFMIGANGNVRGRKEFEPSS
eukprot:COSAG02_NODE_2965_length_7644_cov_1362.789927_6_plen_95_part_00